MVNYTFSSFPFKKNRNEKQDYFITYNMCVVFLF